MKKFKINEGHYLELMDRLHVFNNIFNEHCLEHPLSKKDKELKFLLEKISDKIWDVYQRVGQKDYEKYGKENPIYKVISGRHKKSKN